MPSVVRRIADVPDGLGLTEAKQVGGKYSMSKSNDEIVRDRVRMGVEWSSTRLEKVWKRHVQVHGSNIG